MYVIVVREQKPADGTWGPKARQRYHRRHHKPARFRRLWKALREMSREICLAFECAHQQWVRRP
jgi:hypothetical protein